jgi:hypothetical protein
MERKMPPRSRLAASALGLVLCLTLALPARAEPIDEVIVAQLRAQGYSQIVVTRTLLGRIRIDAALGGLRREIVLNPRTGEILRDYQGGTQMAAAGSGDPVVAGTTSPAGSTATPAVTAVETAMPSVADLSDGVSLGDPDTMDGGAVSPATSD